jgi:preprotein translocase subunit SecE
MVLVIYPFFIPAIPEIKKIIWPTRQTFLDHSARTLIFLFLLTGFVLLFNFLILELLGDIL